MSELNSSNPEEIIRLLKLQAHPEGGYYRETFRDPNRIDGRSASTAIYFLLKQGQVSRWHRVDAVEVWHWYSGAPIRLQIQLENGPIETVLVGPDVFKDQRPQAVVPANAWQTAESSGEWTLVGCTVAPGFEFEHFELR
jgi:uncharacterized protein